MVYQLDLGHQTHMRSGIWDFARFISKNLQCHPAIFESGNRVNENHRMVHQWDLGQSSNFHQVGPEVMALFSRVVIGINHERVHGGQLGA